MHSGLACAAGIEQGFKAQGPSCQLLHKVLSVLGTSRSPEGVVGAYRASGSAGTSGT